MAQDFIPRDWTVYTRDDIVMLKRTPPKDRPYYDTRVTCPCGYKSNWTSQGHAEDLAERHKCYQ